MERNHKLRLGICIAVGFFGLIAAIFGIAAEVKHVRVHEVVVIGDDCFYPSNPAWALGLLSASCLLVSQIIANACGGCICCCKNHTLPSSSTSKTVAILCLVLSWISFANAFFLLLEGAALNGQQQYGQGMIHSCYIIKPGVFAAGAALSLFTCALGIIYYLMATSGATASHAFGQPAAQLAPMFGLNPDYMINNYPVTSSNFPPIAYVAGLELPKRFINQG